MVQAMRCPYCQNPLPAPDASECPACRLTFPRTSTLVGAVPRLTPVVADTTAHLGTSGQARLKRRIQEMQEKFPGISIQVVVHRFPVEHPFSMHVFWLFNAGAFSSDSRRGNDNRGILIVLDPTRHEAAIMPGYGLEPHLKEEATGHLLDLAAPAWERGMWVEGFLRVLDGLDKLLESVATRVEDGAFLENDF